MASKLVDKYFREDHLPHIWCPGCGHGVLMRDVAQAIENIGLDRNKVVLVSGIGCSSRAAGYMDFNTMHTTHGRALAFATGIKMARPDLEVICIMGDGDASAIGGNHLIHAARRNIGITAIIFNNNIYGMTGGQYSPPPPTAKKVPPLLTATLTVPLTSPRSQRRQVPPTLQEVPLTMRSAPPSSLKRASATRAFP